MSDMFDKITGQQDIFKKLLSHIPGFKGYIERENRRSADKEIRDTIAARFEAVWQRVSALQRQLISDGNLSYVDDMEAAAIKFRQFIDRVQRASYGYSGFFDAVKINENELSQVYSYDVALLDLAGRATTALDTVESSMGSEGFPASIRNLVAIAGDCVTAFDQRSEVINTSQASQ